MGVSTRALRQLWPRWSTWTLTHSPDLLVMCTPTLTLVPSSYCSLDCAAGQQGKWLESRATTTATLIHLPIPNWEGTALKKGPRKLRVCALLSRLSTLHHPAWTTTSLFTCNGPKVITVAYLSQLTVVTLSETPVPVYHHGSLPSYTQGEACRPPHV